MVCGIFRKLAQRSFKLLKASSHIAAFIQLNGSVAWILYTVTYTLKTHKVVAKPTFLVYLVKLKRAQHVKLVPGTLSVNCD